MATNTLLLEHKITGKVGIAEFGKLSMFAKQALAGKFLPKLASFLQKLLLFPYLKLHMDDCEILGREYLNELRGPCLFVSNHASHADTALILFALPEKVRENLAVAAASDYFFHNPFLAGFVSLFLNAFPFDRCHAKAGFLQAEAVLQRKRSLLIYPQGTRTAPASEIFFKRGFAALACRMSLPVVPIYIEGTHQMLPKGSFWPKRSSLRIEFAKPVYPHKSESKILATRVEEQVRKLAAAA